MEGITLCSIDIVSSTKHLKRTNEFAKKATGFINIAKDTANIWGGHLVTNVAGDGFEFGFRNNDGHCLDLNDRQSRALCCCISILHQLPFYNRLHRSLANSIDIKIRIGIGDIVIPGNAKAKKRDIRKSFAEWFRLDISQTIKFQKEVARTNTIAFSEEVRRHFSTDIIKTIPFVTVPKFIPRHYLYYPEIVGWKCKNYGRFERIASNLFRFSYKRRRLHVVPDFRIPTSPNDLPKSQLVSEKTAKLFYRAILLKLNTPESNTVRVGIVGGSLIKDLVDIIEQLAIDSDRRINHGLKFIATNSAGEDDNFQYSADYLTTRISKAFTGSSHLVHTSRTTKELSKNIQNEVEKLDFIIGSFGTKNGWLINQLMQDRSGTSGTKNENIKGDIFLIPITEDGKIFSCNAFKKLQKKYHIQPGLESIGEMLPGCTIILPVHMQPIRGAEPSPTSGEKSDVTKIVLKSNRIDHCIISESIAKNLINQSASKNKPWEPKYREVLYSDLDGVVCSSYSNKKDKHQKIKIIGNIDLLGITAPAHRNSMAIYKKEIIISDPPVPADYFGCLGKWFPFCFANETYWFELPDGVRKPGYWSMTSIREAIVAASLIDKDKINILDIGCGSGVIGILLKKYLQKGLYCSSSNIDIDKKNTCDVTFADISENALASTKRNYSKIIGARAEANIIKSNLFDKITKKDFDLIIFSPPFLPDGILKGDPETDVDKEGKGVGIIKIFLKKVHTYLTDGGFAICCLADYLKSWSQPANKYLRIESRKREILYPLKPIFNFPQSTEAMHIHKMKENSLIDESKFKARYFQFRDFISFNMIHLIASKQKLRTKTLEPKKKVR